MIFPPPLPLPLYLSLSGSEGQLGVITKVAIKTPPRPLHTSVTVLACDSFQHVLKTLSLAKRQLAEILSAVEFFDSHSLDLVLHQLPVRATLHYRTNQSHDIHVPVHQ